jgi:hypothetical protein
VNPVLAHIAGVPVEEVFLPLVWGFGLLGATVRMLTMRGRPGAARDAEPPGRPGRTRTVDGSR